MGDFIWVAQEVGGSREVVLDLVVERKRLDDLAQSITGNRFVEQVGDDTPQRLAHGALLIQCAALAGNAMPVSAVV